MTSLVGKKIGRYEITEQVGEGGMAIVYKAHDPRLERDVAIKVILPHQQMTEKFLRRFEREAKALASLSHPYILKVLDYGEQRGVPYLVTEFLPGGTLKQKLDGKPMPWQQAAKLTALMARALEAAHHRGIIHRDVKPSNILITENGQPMLSDFGIAKIIEDEATTVDLTGTGMGIGTPEYMAPEQGLGEGVDHRADIYALGIVFYEMVTGRKPYRADTPMAILLKKNTDPLPRPRQFVPDLPEAVERVLIKALAKRPEDRYQDMGAFATALEALAAGKVILPEQPTSEDKRNTRKWIMPVGIVGALVICVGLIVGGILLANLFKPTSSSPDIPETEPVIENPAVPADHPSPTVTVTPIPLPTATPTRPVVETFSIGQSVLGRPLEVTRVGTGNRIVIITGAIHGNEPNSADLVSNLAIQMANEISSLPSDYAFYFLPVLNPDGLASNSRFNANGVDLNRNWDTLDWVSNTETSSGVIEGGGGSSPLSEPEAAALASWLLDMKQQSSSRVILFNYQSFYPDGLVIPGFTLDSNLERVPDPHSASVGQDFANQLGFGYSVEWLGGYRISGPMVAWCADNGISCLDIELPSRETLSISEVNRHLNVILNVVTP